MTLKKSVHIAGIVFLLGLSSCQARIANSDSPGKAIVCFGDSITRGEGAAIGKEYPSILAEKLNARVINAGVSGDTTRDALKRIARDVLSYDPRMVIVEFSGNDFLRGIPLEETFENLDTIVVKIQERKAMVVLVEVAAGRFGDAYLGGFKKIAKRRHALLISDIMGGIMSNPSLKSDHIHPNDEGYRIIASRISERIKPLLRE